jgi:hypothetical protein
MKYLIYETATGNARQVLIANAAPTMDAGWSVIELVGDETGETHYVDVTATPHVVVAYTAAERALYAANPGEGFRWDTLTRTWVDVRTLAMAKRQKIAAMKAEAVERIQTRFPAITDFDVLQLLREVYLSISPAARAPTTNWQWLIDHYTAGQNAAASVNAASTIAQVNAVTPTWPAL